MQLKIVEKDGQLITIPSGCDGEPDYLVEYQNTRRKRIKLANKDGVANLIGKGVYRVTAFCGNKTVKAIFLKGVKTDTPPKNPAKNPPGARLKKPTPPPKKIEPKIYDLSKLSQKDLEAAKKAVENSELVTLSRLIRSYKLDEEVYCCGSKQPLINFKATFEKSPGNEVEI